MSLQNLLQKMKGEPVPPLGSPGSLTQKAEGTAATRIPPSGSPGSPGSPEKNKEERVFEPEPQLDKYQLALEALAACGWHGATAENVAAAIADGVTDEVVLTAMLEVRHV